MAGLKNKLKQLTSQKSEISKIRRKGENEYKKVKSISRKYSSSLKSTQKRIETFKQNADDINEILNRPFNIDTVQPAYYIIDSFSDLYNSINKVKYLFSKAA